jgi:hypothetical protein
MAQKDAKTRKDHAAQKIARPAYFLVQGNKRQKRVPEICQEEPRVFEKTPIEIDVQDIRRL